MATTPLDWPLTDRLQHVHRWLIQQGEREFAAQIVEAQARLVAQQDLQRIQAAAIDAATGLPGLIAVCKAVLDTAESASQTGHTEAECVAANWDALKPQLRAALAAADTPCHTPPDTA